MISCSKCKAQIADGSKFCSECGFQLVQLPAHPYEIYCSECGHRLVKGSAQGSAQGAAGDPEFNRAAVQESVPENVAGVLCYLFFWISGAVFLLTDKRKFVKFHAAQSVVVFGALSGLEFLALRLAKNAFMDERWYSSLWFLTASIIGFVAIAAWLLLMLSAYEKKKFRVPLAARLADLLAGTSRQ